MHQGSHHTNFDVLMYEVVHGVGVFSKTIATKRKISLLGSQPLKLLSQGQIAAIGEYLKHFWQIFVSQHSNSS